MKHDIAIIDFPELIAVKDKIEQLKIQKTVLSAIPIRMICFAIKYSLRNDDLEREVDQMFSHFENYIKYFVNYY